MRDITSMRHAILEALLADASSTMLLPEHLYLPPSHIKALHPKRQLVVGTVGMGMLPEGASMMSVVLLC